MELVLTIDNYMLLLLKHLLNIDIFKKIFTQKHKENGIKNESNLKYFKSEGFFAHAKGPVSVQSVLYVVISLAILSMKDTLGHKSGTTKHIVHWQAMNSQFQSFEACFLIMTSSPHDVS